MAGILPFAVSCNRSRRIVSQKKEKLLTKDFICITLISFFMFAVFYVLLTTLPLYLSVELHASADRAGLLVTLFLLAAICVRPFAGSWVNNYSNKFIIIASSAAFALVSLLYPLCTSTTQLLAVRILHGVTFGVLTTIKGTVSAKLVPVSRLGEGISLFSAAMGLAMVLGPYTGLYFAKNNLYATSFAICIGLGVFNIILAVIMKVPETHKTAPKAEAPKPSLASSLIERAALPFAAATFFMTFAYSGVSAFLALYAKELNLMDAAGHFLLCYAACLMGCRLFTGIICDRYGPGFVIYPCLGCFAIGLVMLGWTSGAFIMVASGALIGIGYGSVTPTFQAQIIASVPSQRGGTANAMFFNAMDCGLAAGAYLLGLTVDMAGYRSIYAIGAATVILGGALYAWQTRGRSRTTAMSGGHQRMPAPAIEAGWQEGAK